MLLVAKPPTSKNLVELEGIEGSIISTRGWCVAQTDVGDVVWVGMQLVEHGFGKGGCSVG